MPTITPRSAPGWPSSPARPPPSATPWKSTLPRSPGSPHPARPARTATVTTQNRHRRGGSSRPPTGQEPIARLRAWVEQVYRPGYGHLAATLGPCWPAHDLCLYGLDIASELWSVLYLQPARSPALLSAQAEYQARILPALADQLRIETNTCGHPRNPAPAGGQPWSTP